MKPHKAANGTKICPITGKFISGANISHGAMRERRKITNTRKMKETFEKYDLQGIDFDLRVIGMRIIPEIGKEYGMPDAVIDDFNDLKPKDRLDMEREAFSEIKKYQYISAEKSLAIDVGGDDIVLNVDVLKEKLRRELLDKNRKEALQHKVDEISVEIQEEEIEVIGETCV